MNRIVTVGDTARGIHLKWWEDGKLIKREKFKGGIREARRYADELNHQYRDEKYNISEKKVISLDELINSFLTEKKLYVRKSTLKRYKNFLDPFKDFISDNFPLAFKDISKIRSVYTTEAFTNFREINKWSPKTLNGARECISSIFRYAIEGNYIKDNPAKIINKFRLIDKGEVKFYTDKQLNLIWENVKPYWRNHLEFLYLTGIRKGELLNLTWGNIKIEGKNQHIEITNNDEWSTKTGKSRSVPLNNRAIEIIEEQKGKNDKFVFTNPNGGKVHPNSIYQGIKNALKKIDIEGTVHMLRHTFAAKLVTSGESLYTVSKLLGHTDIKTTQIYAHLSPGHLQSAVDKL